MSRKLLIEVLALCIFITLQSINVEAPSFSLFKKSSPEPTMNDLELLKEAVKTFCFVWDREIRQARIQTQELDSPGAFQGCLDHDVEIHPDKAEKQRITECANAVGKTLLSDYTTMDLKKDTKKILSKAVNTCIGKFENYRLDVCNLKELMDELDA